MASAPLFSAQQRGAPVPPEVLRFLENWTAQAPADLAEAARFAALPHSFDAALLGHLHGADVDAAALIAQLTRNGLIITAGPGRYAFEPMLRGPYLRLWQEDDPDSYRQASARAAAYFAARPAVGEVERLETVYHRLGAGDPRGVEALADAFARALATRRLGLAERLLGHADEQAPVLTAEAQGWAALLRARLDLDGRRYHDAEAALHAILAADAPPRLAAEAQMSLGDALLASQRWTEALAMYDAARALFVGLDDHLGAACVLQAQGVAYLHLASSLGGLREDVETAAPRYLVWLRRVARAPFHLYRRLSRRFSRLPNLYFGGDYQDWIIYRFLYRAIDRFERASHQLATASVDPDLAQGAREAQVDVRIHLADLYYRVGRWSQAERLFRELATAPAVAVSDYRRAALQLARGRAALARSARDQAREYLADARQVFARYEDRRALAETTRLLGDVELAAQDPDAAVSLYAESAAAAMAADDLLAATHIWSRLRAMQRRFSLSPATVGQADALARRLEDRAYVVRFRGALLARFRKLATRVASYLILPLTYLVLSIIHIPFLRILLLAGVHRLLCQFVPGCDTWLGDLVISLVLIMATLLTALWTYEFLYLVIGWIFVRRLNLDRIAQIQAEFVVTLPEGSTLRDEQGVLTEVPWAEVESHVSADRAIWRMPAALFSRQILTSATLALVIDGVTRHYQSLQADITGRLREANNIATRRNLDYSFLHNRWSVLAALLVVGMTILSVTDQLDTTCREPNIFSLWSREQSYAYVATGDDGPGPDGLRVVDVWGYPKNLRETDTIDLPGQARDVKLSGHYAYVAAGDQGLRVVDVSDPTALVEVGFCDTPGLASGLDLAMGHAFIADGSAGLRVVNVKDPARPAEVSFFPTPGMAFDVAVARHHAYVADGSAGLRVISVRDPATPVEVDALDTPGLATGVAVAGSYVYIADGAKGVRIVRAQDPGALTEVSAIDTPGQATRVAVAGSSLFVADGNGGLRVLRVEDPTAPDEVDLKDAATPGTARGVALAFVFAFVADGEDGLSIVDVANPCQPTLDSKPFPLQGTAKGVAVPAAIPRPITSVWFELFFWALLFFPIIGLVRLLRNRAVLRRVVGAQFVSRSDWPLWIALALLIALALFHTWTLTW
jgi:tetratricopeptide (TPR) repeat protein